MVNSRPRHRWANIKSKIFGWSIGRKLVTNHGSHQRFSFPLAGERRWFACDGWLREDVAGSRKLAHNIVSQPSTQALIINFGCVIDCESKDVCWRLKRKNSWVNTFSHTLFFLLKKESEGVTKGISTSPQTLLFFPHLKRKERDVREKVFGSSHPAHCNLQEKEKRRRLREDGWKLD